MKALADLLAPKGNVLSRTLTNGTGLIRLEHSGGSETIADFIDSKGGGAYSVQNVDSGKITIAVKP